MSFDRDAFIKSQSPKKILGSGGTSTTKNLDPGNILRTGKTQAKKQQAKQSLFIEKQHQQESLKLAESEGEIARKKSTIKSGKAGRKSLIATSETGTKSTNLGGTV